jgi:hypothetical protein
MDLKRFNFEGRRSRSTCRSAGLVKLGRELRRKELAVFAGSGFCRM